MTRLLSVFLVLLLGFVGGCSKKEPSPRSATSPKAPTPIVLPQLEQNNMFQANSISKSAPPPPDYSFHPLPDEMEQPSKEQAKDLPPAID